MKKIYNKAIRDKIPEIIQKSGKKAMINRLSDEEFLSELEKKLLEEIKEYLQSKSVEELADIIEIIYRIIQIKNIPKEELEKIRSNKVENRGGFKKNLFLVETT